jgi:alpha-beta hydrolase superfamily lysophospholipase
MVPTCDSIELSDGYSVHVRWWLPDSPIGGVLYLHGIESHGGWFEGSASRLAEAGFAVLLPDRRGSGRNKRDRGHAPSAGRLLADVCELSDALARRAAGRRPHLLGVSWGGKLTLAAVEFSPDRFGSLTLVAPGLFPLVDLAAADKLRVAVSAVLARGRKFAIPLGDAELFTRNPERVRFIQGDPLRLQQATASLLLASWFLDRRARCLQRAVLRRPVHLFLAENDRIIENERTRRFVRSLTGSERSITEYRGASHTLEFEPDAEPFFADLVSWLQEANRSAEVSEQGEASGSE